MRRVLWGLLAVLVVTGVLLTVPVLTRSHAQPKPVTTSTDVVAMGSLSAPAPAVQVRQGLSSPAEGVAANAPVLTVTRTGVHSFSAVGVTWVDDPAVTDTVVKIRVQGGSGRWGAWSQVSTESGEAGVGPARPGVRGGTDPFWTGPSTGVQVELVTRSGAQPRDVRLDLVDPGSSDADADLGSAAATSTAHGAAAMPQVYSRADWGADPSIMTWDPEYASTIKAAALHHTDDTNNYTADQVPAMIRAIYQFHAVDRGWGDIGYNALVDKFGRLWEGRTGGLASTVIGAHTGGFNTNTFGISMIGNYDLVDPPAVMISAVEAFIGWKFSLYGVDPTATVTLISGGGGTDKWPVGQAVTLPTIFGHRDTGTTACPGNYGYAKLPAIRTAVAGIVSRTPSIATRYNSEPALRALLGAPVGTATTSNGVTTQVYANGRMYDTVNGTAHAVVGAILTHYLAAGGPDALGAPTTDELGTPDGVGRFNHFASGASIYWTPSTGAQLVKGAIRTLWSQQGWEGGPLGYPTSDELAGDNGVRYSTFQHGTIVWTSAGGAHSVSGPSAVLWSQLGGLTWSGGLPTSNTAATLDRAGAFTHFANGASIFWTAASGAQPVQGPIRTLWSQQGWERGPLGYPTGAEQTAADGTTLSQAFQHGTIVWTSAGGARSVAGAIADKWTALGGLSWSAGLPSTSTTTTPDGIGRYNHFADGSSIYWTPTTGARVVTPAPQAAWAAQGWERGPLGYPAGEDQTAADGTTHTQAFQHGTVVWTGPTDAKALSGAVADKWAAMGGTGWSAGLPTTSTLTTPDGIGRFAHFTDGSSIYWTPSTGAAVVAPGPQTVWAAQGWEKGALGYPTADDQLAPDRTTHVARFQHGVVVWRPSGSWVLRDAVAAKWLALGGMSWSGGLPTTSTLTTPDGIGRFTHFTDGSSIYWSPTTGAHAVAPATRTVWAALGWERGPLGYPTGDLAAVGTTTAKATPFQGGVVYDSPTLGVHAVSGAIGRTYQAQGGPTSALGLPTDDEHAVPGGRQSDFEHGSITWYSATNSVSVVLR